MLPATKMHHARLLRLALQQAGPSGSLLRQRGLHASSALAARRGRRGSPSAPRAPSPPDAAVFEGWERDEEEDEEMAKWFAEVQQQHPSRARKQPEEEELPSTMVLEEEAELEQHEPDAEMDELLNEAQELMQLGPEEFQRRMASFDRRHDHQERLRGRSPLLEEDEDDGIERVTERIPKKKVLKVLGDFKPSNPSASKHGDRLLPANPKNLAPLEKKPKRVNADRVSFRQEKVELTVMDYVQDLLLEEMDSSANTVVPSLVDASVAPDLRRIVLFWEPMRLNSNNQIIGKKKVLALKNRLERQERWVRRHVTQHLNLKYSPIVQFKQRKETKSEEARALFENEMQWLDKV